MRLCWLMMYIILSDFDVPSDKVMQEETLLVDDAMPSDCEVPSDEIVQDETLLADDAMLSNCKMLSD